MANSQKTILHLSTDDFIRNHIILSNKLRILQINMRSIRNFEKFDKLKYFIDKNRCQLDVIIVSESWLNDVHFQYYNIDGFQEYFSGRKNSQTGGGIAVCIC